MTNLYNRYIPQPDGSYTRNRCQDNPTVKQPTHQHKEKPAIPPPPPQEKEHRHPEHKKARDFLTQLLPKNFDTGDLFVILLLLLMAGDNEEERNNAILTIALYFLM